VKRKKPKRVPSGYPARSEKIIPGGKINPMIGPAKKGK
jgi:hypothetical protein